MFSAVEGSLDERAARGLNIPKGDFFATGVSIVLHPANPFSPIIHMNVRYFEMENGLWWFGGGIDLTPHYINQKDAAFFHQRLKEICDRHDENFYPRFKTWADDYFFLPHRNETRGIGGIFFDRLVAAKEETKDATFHFVKDVGEAFCPIYLPILLASYSLPYNENNKDWQYLRRGRYVEFNLVWDKGTKFGLETNGRTESILVSMPPMASWKYDVKTEMGSSENYTLSRLKKGISWI
jgi:coproporphyrinogen III oxidase